MQITFCYLPLPSNHLNGIISLHNACILFLSFFLQEVLDDCISNCNCDKNDYNPICLEEIGLNFYSACAAGCSEFRIDKATNVVSYGGCQCLHQHTNDTLYYGHPSKEVRSILLALDPRGPSQSSESNNFM